MYQVRLRFYWSLFPRVKLTVFQHWFRLWLGADQATSHYLNQGWKVHWRIHTSLDLNDLKLHNTHNLKWNDTFYSFPKQWCIVYFMEIYMIYIHISYFSQYSSFPYVKCLILPSYGDMCLCTHMGYDFTSIFNFNSSILAEICHVVELDGHCF